MLLEDFLSVFLVSRPAVEDFLSVFLVSRPAVRGFSICISSFLTCCLRIFDVYF